MRSKKELFSLINDKQSGSQDLLKKMQKLLLANIHDKKSLISILEISKKKLSHFQVINSHITMYERLLAKNDLQDLKIYLEYSDERNDNKYKNLFNQLDSIYSDAKSILTLSNSRTVIEILKQWAKKNKRLRVVVCESRPKFEGRIAAKELAREGIKTFLIAEALMPKFIAKCDLVLIGADCIMKNGDVVNKTGSLSAAITSKYFQKPFVVAASKEKFSNKKKFFDLREKPAEIFETSINKIKPINIYFEVIPKNLITEIITDYAS